MSFTSSLFDTPLSIIAEHSLKEAFPIKENIHVAQLEIKEKAIARQQQLATSKKGLTAARKFSFRAKI